MTDGQERGPIRVGAFGAVVFGLFLGAAVGLLAYFGGLYGQWGHEPVADLILGLVFVGLGFLRAYRKGIPFPRRWW